MMHNAVHDVLKIAEVGAVVNRVQDICVMLRKSPAKWETFK
jgi:hypothetical protein